MMCKGENTIAAYIWAGFKASPSFGEVYDNWTREAYREVELCEKAVEYAPLLQELYEYMESKFNVWGVYEYETAEIFGGWPGRVIRVGPCRVSRSASGRS